MIYRSMYINITTRVILLTVNSLAFSYFWLHNNIITAVNLGVLMVIQTLLLIYYFNKTNRELSLFFDSVLNKDSTLYYSQSKSTNSLNNLHRSFERINNLIRSIQTDSENQNIYFKTVVEHVGVGIISFDENGKVLLLNKTAQELLGTNTLINIESLNLIDKGLYHALKVINPSEVKLVKTLKDEDILQLSLKATIFKTKDKNMKMVTLQNIKNELEENELDSWQKLIRVLTHEIMNSIAPITSTISTINDYIKKHTTKQTLDPAKQDNLIVNKTVAGLNIIKERSEGLMNFVTKYRDLTSLPKPNITDCKGVDLIQNVENLLSSKLFDCGIEYKYSVDPNDLKLKVDKHLIGQVLLNLINNSISALEYSTNNKFIDINCYNDFGNHVIIEVTDNGKGITNDIIDKIFVPFFTTSKDGSGIGLSISRQIMRLHSGTITARSKQGEKTVFSLRF